ncbi:MAG: radical SAM protein [Deltaproteobacteria bacterium]|nr:radical SAM protein [Deltaproteobacteria bacterium]MBW1948450.1 radical SAM protein [Deltaproteobacteria bacterium]MBW2008728.1 radical SAM protein [Deltaproteobacteria bacterium]
MEASKTTGLTESPHYVRMSLAAAMTLGFKRGLFYRNARLYCINLLLTYEQGCAARCAYCGLSGKRPGTYGGKSFIRVTWPTYDLGEVMDRIAERGRRVQRICLSMITSKRAVEDTEEICARLRSRLDTPISVLVSPTILRAGDLRAFRRAGADKVGVAVDLATPELFELYRGKGVGGPHRWTRYWECLAEALEVFGQGNAGPHFMVGMGETEEEMCRAIQRARDMGGRTHLFSFYPEAGSALEHRPPPPIDQYRRVQLARYLVDERLSHESRFSYDEEGRIADFGLSRGNLDLVIETGEPFRTSGCTGRDGHVACNRPFANSRPGPHMRNYPFPPTADDVARIRRQMGQVPMTAGTTQEDDREFRAESAGS